MSLPPLAVQNTIQPPSCASSTILSGYLFEIGGGKIAPLNGHISQHPLLIGLLQNIFLHCPFTDQPDRDSSKVNLPASIYPCSSLYNIT